MGQLEKMAKLAAFLLLSCAVLLAQGADDAQPQQMSSFFKKGSHIKLSSFRRDSNSPSRWQDQETTTEEDWGAETTTPEPDTDDSNSWFKSSMDSFRRDSEQRRKNSFRRDSSRRFQPSSRDDSWDQETTTEDSWTEPETEESNLWNQPSFTSFRQDSGKHKKTSFRRDSSRRSQPSSRDDSWDQETTTEDSWSQPQTEESNWWNEPSFETFRQDSGKHRSISFRRDSRRNQPSRRGSWDQYTTTDSSWNEQETEESNSWSELSRPDSSWPQEVPNSQDSWMETSHFSNEMSPETEDTGNEDSWTEAISQYEPVTTEDSEGTSELASSSKPASCYQRPERGSCQSGKTRYYYDIDTQSCRVFAWSGCEGNQNRFKTREMCESTCGDRSASIPSGFRCKRDGYYKHPSACEKFIQCSNGRPYEQDCPSGLHFSLASLTCQAPCDAYCDPSLSEECGWDSSAIMKIPDDFRCTRNGVYKHPEFCEKFIQCSNGRAYEMPCPSGLHFSEEAGQCEAPCDARCDPSLAEECGWELGSNDIDCDAAPDQGPCDALRNRYYYDRESNQCRRFFYGGCRGNSNNFKTLEECQKTCGTTIHTTPAYNCPRPNGKFADMYDCTTYYDCRDGQSQVKRCPRGQWFDYQRRTCTSDENASCLYKCRRPDSNYGYLPDCHKYVKCTQGKPTVVRCESGKAFYKAKGRCVPESEVNCGIVPDASLTDSKEYRCPTPSGNYPKVDDCAKYWRCEHSIANEEDCGLKFFNPETRECDDQKNVSCPAYEIKKKVICYFDNDTPSTSKFEPEDLSPYLCTHIHYANAKLEQSGDSYTISSSHRENDIVLRYYQRVVDLKKLNQKLKVLLTLGGWKDSDSAKYSQLVGSLDKWPSFIESVIQYLKLYNFDGLEFDWEFPVCRTQDCNGKAPSVAEKEQFQSFLEMLYSRLSAQKLLLSVKVSGEKSVFEKAYKMEELGKVSDYIVVMAYIPPGESQSDTVPPSILNAGRNPNHKFEDASSIMALWKAKVDSQKLVLGVRGDARVYQLSDVKKTDIYSPISAHGTEPQDMSYRKVCAHLQSHDWSRGSSTQVADYIFQDVTWIGYQSPESLRKFAEHVMRNHYGGVALISNQSDDFKGRCCHVKNPLLKGLVVGFTRRGLTPNEYGCP